MNRTSTSAASPIGVQLLIVEHITGGKARFDPDGCPIACGV
jgi:hypothetical protein